MGKSGKSFYAVRVGRTPGQIFRSWPECEAQVKGVKGAQYKGFKSEGEALSYLGQSHGASQNLGITQTSRQIAKRTQKSFASRGAAAAPSAWDVPGSDAGALGPADHESEHAGAGASASGPPCAEPDHAYCLEFDGGARGNPGPAGAGAVVYSDSTGEELAVISEYLGNQTNNYAEYTGLVRGLQAALACGVRRVTIKGDSKLVVMQMNGAWQVHSAGLAPLHRQASALRQRFESFQIDHIYREANKRADELSNVAMDGQGWTGYRDCEGNVWTYDEQPPEVAHEVLARDMEARRTMTVSRQGNSLTAQCR
ncbi:g3203 [Coccomyxa viridis]|uniref:G3203 protein n=1 Tax=Coccomyxa viridis TaxID=1274662 RepID=A0ABP1FSM1_9CHLO